ncbi:hypothetical protein ABID23_000699 [Bartonella silvatica]|uniref:Transketolase n=1 Tax=Bartonella silvatica TaxID=357760 RepID=A0ABV2HGD6_9HYPH
MMENDIGWHHKVPTEEECKIVFDEIQTKIQSMRE